ncbi:MAG: LPS export ABC transporter permease LptG [Novosphingobium sp.]
MQRLDFFPSRTLTFYLARLFAVRIVAVLVMLVLVLQTLDLLSESGAILEYPGNGEAQLWHYVTLRIPQLVARFLPYSVLLATIITLATLNQNSEVIAMKASGLSAHQILAPLLLTALVASLVSLVFNESVVTRATAELSTWERADYGPLPKEKAVRTSVYFRDGENVLTAARLFGTGAAMTMEGVTWYRRDADGLIVEEVRSPKATFANPGWRLAKPERFDVQSAIASPAQPFVVGKDLDPAEIEMSRVDADEEDIFTLRNSIAAMAAAGHQTRELRGQWWHKLTGPMSAFLMPLLGAIAAFGLARSGQLFLRAVIGMALGFAFFVVDNAALAMGNFGAYPPFLAASAPFFLFLLLGETVLIRTEE